MTGQPAIQHDLDPILAADLRRGEAIALPIALIVLLVVFGFSLAVAIPFLFAACTITGTLAAVYARRAPLPGGLLRDEPRRADRARARDRLLAADRLPLPRGARAGRLDRRGGRADDGHRRPRGRLLRASRSRSGSRCSSSCPSRSSARWASAACSSRSPRSPRRSRSSRRSCRSSAAASGGAARRRSTCTAASGRATRARSCAARSPTSRSARRCCSALAAPALFLRLTPGSFSGIPSFPESMRGYALLRDRVGAGAVMPTEIVVDGARPSPGPRSPGSPTSSSTTRRC